MRYYSHNRNGDWRSGSDVWNIIGGAAALILILFFVLKVFDALNGKITYQTEQTFISFETNYVVTNSDEYLLSIKENILVDKLETTLESGDKIVLTVSKWTGDLMEISSNGELVYQVKQASWNEIIYEIVIFVGLSALFAVFFYSINAKNPPVPFSIIKQIFIVETNKRTPHHSDY